MTAKRRKRPVAADEEPTSANGAEEIAEATATAAEAEPEDAVDQAPSQGRHENDIEAAMEEDIAGEATGVSRRNPEYAAAPSMGLLNTTYGSPQTARRSGLEEADWFNQFRNRLVSQSEAQVIGAVQENRTAGAADPDDPVEDEATEYSEEG